MIAGISGHQELGTEKAREWLSRSLRRLIADSEIEEGRTSLAVGADQLFARLLLDAAIPYVAVIPCRNYESTFGNSLSLAQYHELLRQASQITQLGYPAPSEEAFYAAG